MEIQSKKTNPPLTDYLIGSWYLLTMTGGAGQEKASAKLVLASRGGFNLGREGELCTEDKKVIEKLPQVTELGQIKEISHIFGEAINYWDSFDEARLVKTRDGYFTGIGGLNIEKYSYSSNRWITELIAKELLTADPQNVYHLDGCLFVVRYRDSNDRNTNPYHQTAFIAKDEQDISQMLCSGKFLWFGEGYRNIANMIGEPNLQFVPGIVVMPGVLCHLRKMQEELVQNYEMQKLRETMLKLDRERVSNLGGRL
jgi:hypothetical protein